MNVASLTIDSVRDSLLSRRVSATELAAEALRFADFNVDLNAPVRLYDTTDTLVATFTSIQDAIDAALDGYRITAAAGTYTEDLDVDVAAALLQLDQGGVDRLVEGPASAFSRFQLRSLLDL